MQTRARDLQKRIREILMAHGIDDDGLAGELVAAVRPAKAGGPPAAVEAFRAAACRYPDKAAWPAIAQAVGEEPAAIERWSATVGAYVLMGWNPANVAGMLEFFRRGVLPAPGPRGDYATAQRSASGTLGPAGGRPAAGARSGGLAEAVRRAKGTAR